MVKINQFLKEVRAELGRVNWPTNRQTTNFTLIVIGMSLFLAVFLGALDLVFARVLTKLI
ncbi:MAG: preprotein translocase subunit SecE [Candidatus Yanofskybacteria bacterium CG10_big_fil_rev_8_21_14_0_10_46_23]|uniref:Protein translocase subunit SecE n=1 Tax=Candidatus Yanofskybacteria bacterium CG10_big_fil_rev_8_21_14_0_10_46_23 TaxID=1975098 RepID=A0A2H0R453_9BACT|nr:MAG: preprotein translocase subunit SecE [Candidatus Yanofskybacteria bacterium CG10_big_fil_rev_8_21_14_0_10_46_23]